MLKRTRFPRRVPVVSLTVVMLLSLVAFPASGAPAPTPPGPPIMGFTADKAAVERQWETLFKSVPDPASAEANTIAMSEHPIMYATAWDWWNVQYSMDKLRSYGVKPEIKTYYPYGSWPGTVSVEMVAPTQRALKVKEDGGFPWEKYWDDVSIGFNAYSPNGDATAEVVYANYGGAADYAMLKQMGVDVKGKIAIVRYGGGPSRGAKQAQGALAGAAGVLLYDDPVEDGCILGPVFPTGQWRPPDSIQRGSVMWVWEYVGDPLTPGWAATKNAPRIKPEQADNLPKGAMSTPLSYGEVSKLLAALGGQEAPASWQGGLGNASCTSLPGVTPVPVYHVGPGPTKVHMKVDLQTGIKPIWDVMVQIPGTKHPEQMVVLAGHRDGWVYGSSDSTAGFTVVMEMARGFGQLLKQGWRPDRTIVIGGWDAEEPFELGSVEWVEELQKELGKNAVAYVNLDGAGGGVNFGTSAVPALDDFIYEVTKEVTEPRNGKTVYQDWVDRRGGNPRPPIGRFGGGSDYSPFINYIGMATMSIGFSSSTGGYHSAYDDLYMMSHFGDPGYLHHATAAQLTGLVAMRLASADILPFRYSQYATAVSGYLDNLNTLQVQLYGKEMVSLEREKKATLAWGQAATALEAKIDSILASNPSIPRNLKGKVELINSQLLRQERDLTQSVGLPGRPWFKHMIYATGLYQGYSVEYLPALTDMVTAGEWTKVRFYQMLLDASLFKATLGAKIATPR